MAANGCDQEHFAALEERAERGLFRDYRDTGEALRQIRDEEQACWKPIFGTWERYIQERWGISRQHANYYIQAEDVAADLSSRDDDPPLPLRHATLLYRFKDPATRREVAAEIAPMSFRDAAKHVTELTVGVVERPRRQTRRETPGQLRTLAAAVKLIESIDLDAAARAINRLDQRSQKQLLRRVDRATGKLGALPSAVRRRSPN